MTRFYYEDVRDDDIRVLQEASGGVVIRDHKTGQIVAYTIDRLMAAEVCDAIEKSAAARRS